jgi:amino acid transporter
MKANLLKIIAAVIIGMGTLIVATNTIGALGTALFIFVCVICFLIIGVDFEITKEKPEDWDGA